MRLFDTYCPETDYLEQMWSGIKAVEPMIVDITNVVGYMAQFQDDPGGFPLGSIVVSPWPAAFFEYKAPREARGYDRIGVFTYRYDIRVPEDAEEIITGLGSEMPPLDRRAEVRWVQLFVVFSQAHDGAETPIPVNQYIATPFFLDDRGERIEGLRRPVWTEPKVRDKELVEFCSFVLDGLLSPVFLAISMANCKNVQTVENKVPEKVARKRARQGKPPGTKYYTLEIDGFRDLVRYHSGGGTPNREGLKRALHLVRGHPVTYSADRPLFGRITGTFWREAHVRGHKKHGEIKKDYKVTANENK